MKYQVITIGHQYGSHGRKIAHLLAEKLQYRYYDSQITEDIASKSGFHQKFIKEHSEETNQKSSFLFRFNNWNEEGLTLTDQLYIMQRNYIKDVAQNEKCIIVGHCSDYVLRKHPSAFHIFLKADIETRLKIVNEENNESLKTIEDIKNKDKKRKTYYRYYTDRKIDDLNHYDLVLDTTHYTCEDVVCIIYDILEKGEKYGK